MENRSVFSKNKRIAFVCFSHSFGGLELSMLKLAAKLNERGAECMVIVPPSSTLSEHAAHYKLKTAALKPNWKYADVIAAKRLADILRTNQIEILIAMQSKDISIMAVAHTIYPCVKLAFFQEMQSGINKRDLFHSWMYSKLSIWLTLTERMRLETLDNTRMHADKVFTLPIGTDMKLHAPELYSRQKAREMFGIPQGGIVAGVLGRLDPQKGQEEFIRAIPDILKHEENIQFVIAGDESAELKGYKEKLIELGRSLGLNSNLKFLPFTNAVPDFMAALDIFVMPSHNETFGFVLIEAMAMKKAVIATDAGGVPEIITDKTTGLLIPPRNVSAITEAVLLLIKNDGLRKNISEEAGKEARKRFDIELSIGRLVQLLDAV